jgi:trans-aconitate 2-methyltransferase
MPPEHADESPQHTEDPRLHEWDAEAYHRASDPQYELALALLDTCPLAGDETLVDAGCGSGRVTEKVLERLPDGKVIAVDRSRNMLDLATHVLVPRFGEQVELVQADLQTFCLDAAADAVFSSMALHFVPDHARLFQNLRATLKPGGWLAVQFGASAQAQHNSTEELLRGILGAPPFASYLSDWRPDFIGGEAGATRQHLADAGFTDVDVREHQANMSLGKGPQLEEFVRTILLRQALMKLPDPALQRELLERVVEGLGRSGALGQPWTYIVARARVAEVV